MLAIARVTSQEARVLRAMRMVKPGDSELDRRVWLGRRPQGPACRE
eukprot:gene44510-10761_t